jgi:hypothetical protein
LRSFLRELLLTRRKIAQGVVSKMKLANTNELQTFNLHYIIRE